MRLSFLTVLAASIGLGACGGAEPYTPHTGDVVFQTLRSEESEAIQRATRSPYSHVGVIFVEDGEALVREAVGPVVLTPLGAWAERGENGHVVVKRLIDAERLLVPDALARLREEGAALDGRPYDRNFGWSDDSLYCSELAWKLFERALDVQIGEMETMRELDLSDSLVKAQMHARWGDSPPLDEPLVSPAAIFRSNKLRTVYEGTRPDSARAVASSR